MAAAAKAAAGAADEMAAIVHRATDEEPDEIREQGQEGDPKRYLGRSVHWDTQTIVAALRRLSGESWLFINRRDGCPT